MAVTFGSPTPSLPSSDVERAKGFYREVLSFEEVASAEGFALLRRDDASITLWGATDESWKEQLDPAKPVRSGAETFLAGTASCSIQVTGVEDLYEHCREHGIVHPNAQLQEQPWGTREFGILDPDGNLVTFWELA